MCFQTYLCSNLPDGILCIVHLTRLVSVWNTDPTCLTVENKTFWDKYFQLIIIMFMVVSMVFESLFCVVMWSLPGQNIWWLFGWMSVYQKPLTFYFIKELFIFLSCCSVSILKNESFWTWYWVLAVFEHVKSKV